MLYRTFFLIPFLIGLNWAFEAGFDRIDPLAEYGRSLSAHMDRLDTSNEVLFIGDSRTHQGVDPRVFEATVEELTGRRIRSLNLGRPGMQTPFFYYTLQNYLELADEPPKAIFVNASYYLLSGYDWMAKIYLTSFQPTPEQAFDAWQAGLLAPWTAASWPIHSRIPFFVHLAASNTHLMMLAKPDPADALKAIDKRRYVEGTIYSDQYRGYLPRGKNHIEPHWKSVGQVFNPGRAEPIFLDYFRRFIALAERHGVKIFLYEFPWPPAHDTKHDRDTIAHYQETLKEIGSDFENFEFIDYEHFMEYQYFVDPLHLNSRGAEIHSARMARWFSERSSSETSGIDR